MRGIASYQEGLRRTLDQHRDARATVRAAVHHHLAWVEANRDLAFFMYERGRPDWQPAHGVAVRKLNRSAAEHIRDWIAPLAARGVLRDLPLPVLAACVVGPTHFIARRWLSGLIAARPTSFTDALADAAWSALSPGKVKSAASSTRAVSPGALAETAALDAAMAADAKGPGGRWSIAQMNLNSLSPSPVVSAQVRNVRIESGGCAAMIEIELVNSDNEPCMRAHVVCMRAETSA